MVALMGMLQPKDLESWGCVESEIAPQPENRAVYDAMYREYLGLYLNTKDMAHRLRAIAAGNY